MNKSHRIFSFSSWLFYGYFGSPRQKEIPLHDKIIRFSGRFIIIYALMQIIWPFIHLYYQSWLAIAAVELNRVFTSFPPLSPVLVGGSEIMLFLNGYAIIPMLSWTVNNLPVFPSLMLSTSGISFFPRIRATVFGLAPLFVSHIASTLYKTYSEIIKNSNEWVRVEAYNAETMKVQFDIFFHDIKANIPGIAKYFAYGFHYQMLGQYITPLLLWAVMAALYKKGSLSEFPKSLL